MHTTVTVKFEAESKAELMESMPDQIEHAKAHYKALQEEAAFGRPDKVELRFLIIGGQWREPVQEEGIVGSAKKPKID